MLDFLFLILLQIPEASERFTVTLTEVTGGGRLGSNTIATLNINKNDDAIFFEGKQLNSSFCQDCIHYPQQSECQLKS